MLGRSAQQATQQRAAHTRLAVKQGEAVRESGATIRAGDASTQALCAEMAQEARGPFRWRPGQSRTLPHKRPVVRP